jgi:diaminopimelate epimerase
MSQMSLKFVKMQALGNDFVVLDGVSQNLDLSQGPALFRRLGDRRLGVGCDQILLIEPAPNAQADFAYRIFNADGSEVGQCGNGARCLARFVERRGLSQKRRLQVATQTTLMTLELLDEGWVRADLSLPQFEPESIPLARSRQERDYVLHTELGDIRGGAVSVGNPHFVIEVGDVDQAPVAQWGPLLASHPDFPQGVNVGFVQRLADDHLRLRVFERGVGETPACGSGACAAAVIMRRWGRCAAQVRVDLPGGQLRVQWDEGQPVSMEGPAEWVYEGEIEL